jgi:4-hydroxybenzoate polyprenyltransferase
VAASEPEATAAAHPPARPSLARRFLGYQAVRFPLPGLVPLLTLFTFSSAAFSRRARGAPGFVSPERFAVGAFTALTIFFLLRVLDEHKDAALDRRYRPELPVPSGVVSLRELRAIGAGAAGVAVLLNLLVQPRLLLPLLAVAAWAVLMTKEFFVSVWLRAHPAAYLLTHMAIMPLVDAYTTGLDWLAAGAAPPPGLVLFLAVTFLNGVLIEIGRKVRDPAGEREGVDTYTSAWGLRTAPAVWLATLLGSALLAGAAARHTGTAALAAPILAVLALLSAVPAIAFLRAPGARAARRIDLSSQVWPAITYLLLGAMPFVVRATGRP